MTSSWFAKQSTARRAAAGFVVATALFAGTSAVGQDATMDTILDPIPDATGATTQLGQPAQTQQQVYCQQLERQLGRDWQQGTSARDLLPRLEAQMAKTDRQLQRAQAAADQSDCYDYFLFTKSWRDTPQCRQLQQQIEGAQRTLADLDRQRRSAGANQDHNTQQDAVLAELARNRCGPQYAAALQKRPDVASTGFWSDGEGLLPGSGTLPDFGAATPGAPGSTYRTICVRMCDGYYFPINFATSQESFPGDEQTCQRQCGSPAKLYFYPNPGGEVQQATALDGTPYTALRNAFRYRKELVRSCSCKGPSDGSDTTADVAPMPSDITGSALDPLPGAAPAASQLAPAPIKRVLPAAGGVAPKLRQSKLLPNPSVVLSNH